MSEWIGYITIGYGWVDMSIAPYPEQDECGECATLYGIRALGYRYSARCLVDDLHDTIVYEVRIRIRVVVCDMTKALRIDE